MAGGERQGMAEAGISVIMPIYNAAKLLPRSLPPLIAMLRRGEVTEIICVDDTSSDESAAVVGKRDFNAQIHVYLDMGGGSTDIAITLKQNADRPAIPVYLT